MTRWKLWAAGIGASVLALLAALARAERRGARQTEQEGIVDASKRVEKGRAAVAAGRDGGTPTERVRKNDSAWR